MRSLMLALGVLLAPTTALATQYAKTAVVALGGGDYTNPAAAMDDLATWCGTPTAMNPCLIKVMPGAYNIGPRSLTMRSYVDIEGSGVDVTTISGTAISGVVRIYYASNVELRSAVR